MLRRPPTAVRALVEPGERILAWSPIDGPSPDSFAVATSDALYLPVPHHLRLSWHLVTRATWSEDAVLVVEGRAEAQAPDRLWRVRLTDVRTLPTVICGRVTSSVVISERVAIEGDLGARIVARRVGEGLRWTVTFDPGLDPGDAEVRRRADDALADLRSTFGV